MTLPSEQQRKERIDRGIKIRCDSIYAMMSHRELSYLALPRLILIAGMLILLLGNLIVIMLEGLVVAIQTTRLILFEFFIRFLQGTGRIFRPLAAPAGDAGIRRKT